MSALDQLINIQITQQTSVVPTASFSIPALFGDSNRFAAVTPAPTATNTSGSNVLTGVSSLNGISPGCSIVGAGIPLGNYVQSVSNGKIVMANANGSANATSSGSVTLTITDVIRGYTGLSGMLADGFEPSDPEYIRAKELLSQAMVPALFYVGSYSPSVTQVDTIMVGTLDTSHLYTFQLEGQTISYQAVGGNAQQDILSGLLADIATVFPSNAPVTGVVTGTGSGATLTLTSIQPGAGVTYSDVDADLTQANVTPNHTIVTDIQQAQIENDSWYGIVISSNADQDIEQVASYIETQLKIFIAVSQDGTIPTGSTTDLASLLKGFALKRTALIFSIAGILQGIDAAWMGGQLPATPGSNNWAFKTLVGISPDTLSSSQQAILIGVPVAQVQGKNVNIYQTVGGVNITEMGTMAGGQFIDITIGIDWFKSTTQTNIYEALTQASKIPYTDTGVAILISAIRAAIDQGIVNGLIDGNSPISITAPPVLSVPANQRAGRVAPTISFSFRLAGAINAVNVAGIVTV